MLTLPQLVYSISLGVGYYGYVISGSLWKSILPTSTRVTRSALASLTGFFIQAAGKYVTAEGEHFILFFFGTPEQQVSLEFILQQLICYSRECMNLFII